MKSHAGNGMSTNEVRALFSDHATLFVLREGATLADLVERLDELEGWNSGAPQAVFLRFGKLGGFARGASVSA